ncbi:hypothetical protein BO70DRAFT_361565 [Aspergillus heteromorphus CBS 117.55]|uniref:Uncharacterized protein n=1 Tax=Aspergillus heteromorphus CBS 117.55 TaxID=1448321 RepID=A0A317WBX2_9EURO|nr:uncharacterized protein BO70DRAFT_361565 [Aspergillus heteromorphus CBS 117.55]PWY83445.1 hypothetical protein BO70DRAFT_361565 [Aspergillus heteromorphus CBS 117.55]
MARPSHSPLSLLLLSPHSVGLRNNNNNHQPLHTLSDIYMLLINRPGLAQLGNPPHGGLVPRNGLGVDSLRRNEHISLPGRDWPLSIYSYAGSLSAVLWYYYSTTSTSRLPGPLNPDPSACVVSTLPPVPSSPTIQTLS